MEKRYSDIIYVVKALAIICTIAAHMPAHGELGKLLDIFGTMGVPAFLFISGMFWKDDGIIGCKKYINKIAIPWVCGGTINWIVSYLRQYNSLTLIEFVVGKGSYLWYLSVSVGIMLVWSFFSRKWRIFVYVLSVLRILNVHFEWIPYINTNLYLSLLYWNFWFANGYLLRRNMKNVQNVIDFLVKYRFLGITVWMLLGAIYTRYSRADYFTWMAIPFSFASIWMMFVIAWYAYINALLIDIGKNTLSIYIWHILVAGFIAARGTGLGILYLLLPVVTLLLVYGILKCGSLVLKKVNMSWVAIKVLGWRY